MQIPRRLPTNDSEDGDGREGFSFRNMMAMMMQQSCLESEQRERQCKNVVEQRDCEYQLHCKEMAIPCKDACAQRQMMNLMFSCP